MVIAIGLAETYRVSLGWATPTGNGFNNLKDEYEPGQLFFDPLGIAPEDDEEFAVMQTRELNNGRLAMVGIAGFVVQELVNGRGSEWAGRGRGGRGGGCAALGGAFPAGAAACGGVCCILLSTWLCSPFPGPPACSPPVCSLRAPAAVHRARGGCGLLISLEREPGAACLAQGVAGVMFVNVPPLCLRSQHVLFVIPFPCSPPPRTAGDPGD